MKKTSVFLFFALALWLPAHAQVVITEIMYNPPESGTDTLEYLEIHNHGASAVNLDGWKFTAGIKYTFAGTSLPANGYLVLAVKASAVQSVLGIQNAIQWDQGEALKNSGETLLLVDPSGNFVDSVKFSNAAPWPTDANGNGHSLTLCDPTLDNNDPANWTAATSPMGFVVNGKDVYGNPNAGCATGTLLADDQVSVPSGKSVVVDMLSNDLIPGSTFAVSISQNPAHGTASLVNNKITYKSTAGYCGSDLIKYKVVNGGQNYEASIKINVYCYPLYTIPQVHGEDAVGKADSANVYCELQGIVYGGNLVGQGLRFGLIDANNWGILINNDTSSNFGYTVKEGDKVRCFGQIQQVAGVTRMELDTIIKVGSNFILVAPLGVEARLLGVLLLLDAVVLDLSELPEGEEDGVFSPFGHVLELLNFERRLGKRAAARERPTGRRDPFCSTDRFLLQSGVPGMTRGANFTARRSSLGTSPDRDGGTRPAGASGGGTSTGGTSTGVPAAIAMAALEKLGVWDKVETKVAQAENVRAALKFVATGEAAAGIVYQTDATAEPQVKVLGAFPDDTHAPIVYPAAVLQASTNPDAPRFLAYLKSPKAADIFRKAGFKVLE